MVAPAAGERDLAGMAAQVLVAPREDGVQLVVGLEQRHEHGCLRLVGGQLRRGRRGRGGERSAQLVAQVAHAPPPPVR
jgi:hypothetical protein